ncbi:hypothetical protein SAY87_007157 [Trapa incisa]|uniref:Protein kinase domain-containing protein n=2 Tax=Trapa TaxID=22665 RepID=A0AAN7KXG5_TRANT|nr:hypothetical protein SAY87_007157 [Trapa incisa]KAK4774840.1 hypothetical protein SAY86_009775 [Trapa natans]
MSQTLRDKYQLLEEIGRGRFGKIFRCFSAENGGIYAAKVIDKSLLEDATDRECLENEPKIMALLSPHPNIVSIVDAFDSSDESLAIVMDLCGSQNLYDRIARSGRAMAEPDAASLMKQLLLAVAHCHRLGVAHRDIKPENVFFDLRGATVKLGDFGSAVWLGGGSVTGVVGTPYYVAPEVLTGRDYGEKVDVWSCGVIIYIMLSGGIPPFYGDSAEDIFEAVVRANLRFPPKIFRSVSASAKDLIRKMVCRDASRRISAEQALRHPWILGEGQTSERIA